MMNSRTPVLVLISVLVVVAMVATSTRDFNDNNVRALELSRQLFLIYFSIVASTCPIVFLTLVVFLFSKYFLPL